MNAAAKKLKFIPEVDNVATLMAKKQKDLIAPLDTNSKSPIAAPDLTHYYTYGVGNTTFINDIG